MKGTIRSAALSALLLATVALAAQDGALLQRTLQENTVEKYKLDMKMNSVIELPNGMGEQEMSLVSAGTYRVKIGKLDSVKGTAAIETTTTIEKFEPDGMLKMVPGADKIPPPVTQKGTMDRQGRLKFEIAKGKAKDLLLDTRTTSILNPLIELPDKAIKIGDTWQILVPKSAMSKTDQFVTATLKGEKDVDGQPAWVVSVDGTVKLAMDPTAMPSEANGQQNPLAGQKMSLKADIQVSGDGLISKATGQTLKFSSKTKSKQQVNLVDMGMTIDSSATIETIVTVAK